MKRGLSGMPSAVPRIHLPSVRGTSLPRQPHLHLAPGCPRDHSTPFNRPQSASKTLLRLLLAQGIPNASHPQSSHLEQGGGHQHRTGSTEVGTESVMHHLNWGNIQLGLIAQAFGGLQVWWITSVFLRRERARPLSEGEFRKTLERIWASENRKV